MSTPDIPVTTAIRALRAAQVPFVPHFYAYQEHGGTGVAAGALGVDEHAVIKTLVMQTETRMPLIILMHGDREVSTKQLARALGVKNVDPCDPVVVTRHTGYQVGGVSPFGTRGKLPVYVEEGIMFLPLQSRHNVTRVCTHRNVRCLTETIYFARNRCFLPPQILSFV